MGAYSFKADPRISDYAREKLRDFCGSLESDVVALAKDFGLKVFDEDLLPYERGFLERTPSYGSSSGWVVKLNRTDRPATKNFTVAHELGHFMLHGAHLAKLEQFDGRMNRNAQGGMDPFSYLEDRDRLLEAEANQFAATLLMPPNLFKPAHHRLGGDITALSRLFLVAEGTVARRIKELGL
jgi:Zn-dependent peptidase ImmA (M78 family)